MTSPNKLKNGGIVRSPFHELLKQSDIPDVSLPTFIFNFVKSNEKFLGDKAVVIDPVTDKRIRFIDLEPLSKNFASALIRKGFKKGDILYYVTYNTSLIYVLFYGAWLCGGGIRGCFQKEGKEEMARQMKETKCRFVLCDNDTASPVKWAIDQLDWPVFLLCIDGEVEGAIPVENMVYNDDGSAFQHEAEINPKEDIVYIPTTNGSSGLPKGALHSHYNLVAVLFGSIASNDLASHPIPEKIFLSVMGNYNIGPFFLYHFCLVNGWTSICISKFDKSELFQHIQKYQPDFLFLYPYLANWFARCSEIESHDISCLKELMTGGSVFDYSALSIIYKRLPDLKVAMIYGMTEALSIASTGFGHIQQIGCTKTKDLMKTKVTKIENEYYVSCGVLVTFVEAKILDVDSGEILGRMEKGRLLIRAPYFMKGYLKNINEEVTTSEIDADGWLDTGDLGFFDDEGHLYIVDRLKSIFKYQIYHVSPSEIEMVIGEHPAVLSVGVIGIPDPVTTSIARAYVVLKPGYKVTEKEIQEYVAGKTPFFKHLYGGVIFVDALPETRGGKLDRKTLLERAMNETKSNLT